MTRVCKPELPSKSHENEEMIEYLDYEWNFKKGNECYYGAEKEKGSELSGGEDVTKLHLSILITQRSMTASLGPVLQPLLHNEYSAQTSNQKMSKLRERKICSLYCKIKPRI